MTRPSALHVDGVAVEKFLRARRQLQDLLTKMTAFATKTPELLINKFKLGIINEQLLIANALLGDNKPFKEFDVFLEGSLPTNSDAVVVLSQYLSCLEIWRSTRVVYDEEEAEWYWNTDDDTLIQTTEPADR
jgi:hypothetical protein